MKKFFFRLDTLLKVRKTKEGRRQKELSYIQQKLLNLREKEEMTNQQIHALLQSIRVAREEKELGLQETYFQLLEHLKSSLVHIQEMVMMQTRQEEEKKEQLKQVVYERKVIEKIKEKQYAQWRMQVEKFDDLSSKSN